MKSPEQTMEYWVNQASEGKNKAECWQNCNRILKEALESVAPEERQESPLNRLYTQGFNECRAEIQKNITNFLKS